MQFADVKCKRRTVRLVLFLYAPHAAVAAALSETVKFIAHNNMTGLLCVLKELASTRMMHYGY